MKLGYSNLLGEHLDAEGVSYGDCERFQIVCPACHEPVFKAERDQAGGRAHYLSHYPTSQSYVTDCEQRVAGMLPSTMKHTDILSRKQTLASFLDRLPELVTARRNIVKEPWQKTHQPLRKSKAVSFLRNLAFDQASRSEEFESESWFDDTVQDYVTDLASIGITLETSFALCVQKRIARDIWLTALTGNGRAHHDFLFHHSYLTLVWRIVETAKHRELTTPERDMADGLGGLVHLSKGKGFAQMQKMSETPAGPPIGVLQGPDLLNRAMDHICHEMIGILIGLPYLEVLQELRGTRERAKHTITTASSLAGQPSP